MATTPFEVTWDEGAVARLLDRVHAYEFPPPPEVSGWAYGCDAEFLGDLCDHWTDG